MKKLSVILCGIGIICMFGGCNNETEEVEVGTGEEVIQGSTQVMGQITAVYGNQITLQLAASSGAFSEEFNREEGAPEVGGVLEKEGMSEREGMPTGDAAGEMPTGDAAGEMPAGEMPTGEMPTGEGFDSSQRENMQQDRENMVGDRENMAEGMGQSGMMGGAMSTEGGSNYSGEIELTEETANYTIPVGTVVEQMGMELSFSQLTVDSYVILVMDEEGTILSVQVLG